MATVGALPAAGVVVSVQGKLASGYLAGQFYGLTHGARREWPSQW